MRLIFIHGSWHWGDCFAKTAQVLERAGLCVELPDLISHGRSRATWDSFSTMAEYAAPVESLVQTSSDPVVLISHSMGGVTASYLAQKYPDRVAALIYIAAFMCPAGNCADDYILRSLQDPQVAARFAVISEVRSNELRGLKVNVADREGVAALFYHDCSSADIDLAIRHLNPITSGVPYGWRSDVTPERFGRVPRTYIACTQDRAIPYQWQRLMVEECPGTNLVTMQTSHSPFLSCPEELARNIFIHSFN